LCGILFRIGDFLGIRLQTGWPIIDKADLAWVGSLFQTTLAPKLGDLLTAYLTFDGWASFFRDRLSRASHGRGRVLSMLGYSLLARSNTSFEEIRDVILEHSRLGAVGRLPERLDVQLERQQLLVEARFGKQIE
jgi:hypothetical protein